MHSNFAFDYLHFAAANTVTVPQQRPHGDGAARLITVFDRWLAVRL
jgi:hypothetical protein